MRRKTSAPEEFARALLKRFDISPPVNLFKLTSKIGIEIRDVESYGFDGALVCAEGKPIGVIAINENIRESGRKRFTVAHEIGHYILPGHGQVDCICNSNDVESWSKELPDEEIAANRFASELLMPADRIARIVSNKSATIKVSQQITREYGVSLTAAAVKCVDLTSENCALAVSEKGIIKWCRPGPEFQHYISANRRVSDESWASRLFSGSEERELDGAVPAECWISGYKARQVDKVWEDSILLPFYDRVLSIITNTRNVD
jgi:hypothetical protein